MMKTFYVKTRRFSGFTLVELLISVTLSALLLTAVAVALRASFASYQVTRDMSRASETALHALSRISTELRTASAVARTEPNSQCTFITIHGRDITYRFDDSSQRLYLVTNDDSGDVDYIVCNNLTQAVFSKVTAFDELLVEYVRSVQISLTVTVGGYSGTFSSAVAIMRNL